MNIIIDEVPTTVEVGGTFYKIRTDFRISMMFESLLCDVALASEEKIYQGLLLYYPEMPKDLNGAVEAMLTFYLGGKETAELKQQQGNGRDDRIYDFEHDAGYIYAAFRQEYGIDLQREKMHWWEWKELFNGLTDRTLFVKIMGYRSMEINDSMSKHEKEYYKKMKKIYRIPLPKAVADKEDAILQALEDGEDIGRLIER